MTEPYIKYFDIGPYPVFFAFTSDKEAFYKELKRLKVLEDVEFIGEGANARTHYFTSKGDLTIIVTIDLTSNHPFDEVCGLLVHEAVHVFQQLLNYIGDSKTSNEIEAYHIGSIAQSMISELYEEK